MALYRHVYLKFWKDDKVMELFSVEEKLLFLFLLTNPNTTQIGVYKSLPKEIAFMTGIDEEEVSIYMVNPKAPCFIKDDEDKYIYLILPVNFNTATN